MAVLTRSSVFWIRLVTPSVTSWSSASMSFVIADHDAGAVPLAEAERERFRWAKSRFRRSARTRSPTQPVGTCSPRREEASGCGERAR
jgi:hypothetical protein